jgi:hypothetical protein
MRGVKLFRCSGYPPCEKEFCQKDHLVAHLKLHILSPDAVLECPHKNCFRSFVSLMHVQRHLKEFHNPDKHTKYSCPFCDATFQWKKELRSHTLEQHDFHELRCIHENCNCGRIFVTPSRLKEHHLSSRGMD